MGIKADCQTYFGAAWPEGAQECYQSYLKLRKSQYGEAIAAKFDAGADFTISDVWRFLVGIYELPANGLQYLAAQNVATNDFFELNADKFADPSIGLCLGAWILVVFVLSILANLNN